jgi:hypothetical protein
LYRVGNLVAFTEGYIVGCVQGVEIFTKGAVFCDKELGFKFRHEGGDADGVEGSFYIYKGEVKRAATFVACVLCHLEQGAYVVGAAALFEKSCLLWLDEWSIVGHDSVVDYSIE